MQITRLSLPAAVCLAAAFGAPAMAATIDSINPNATPPFVEYAGPQDIGWYYTPTFSYTLTGITTEFVAVPNGTGQRTITVQIQTERPVNGGTVLAQGTFSANSASGGFLGSSLPAVQLTAGTTYFVDFLDTVGMGVNLGSWQNDQNGNPMPSNGATTNLGAWYGNAVGSGSTDFSTVAIIDPAYYTTTSGNVSFSEPILFFAGTVPEPASAGILLAASGLLLRRKPR